MFCLCHILSIYYGVYLYYLFLIQHVCLHCTFMLTHRPLHAGLLTCYFSVILCEVCLVLNEVWDLTLVEPPTCLTESFLVIFAHEHATCKQKPLTKSLPRFYCQPFQAASSLDTISVMFSYLTCLRSLFHPLLLFLLRLLPFSLSSLLLLCLCLLC